MIYQSSQVLKGLSSAKLCLHLPTGGLRRKAFTSLYNLTRSCDVKSITFTHLRSKCLAQISVTSNRFACEMYDIYNVKRWPPRKSTHICTSANVPRFAMSAGNLQMTMVIRLVTTITSYPVVFSISLHRPI